jgi:hypothetical protein
VSRVLGAHLRRLPDGEQVTKWIGSQGDTFTRSSFLEPLPTAPDHYGSASVTSLFRLRPGVDPADVTFGSLGYATAARESFAIFSRLQEERPIPAGIRFQVSLTTRLRPSSHSARTATSGCSRPTVMCAR